jgi:hypothetical protein
VWKILIFYRTQQLDIDAAKKSGVSGANLARLALTPGKLESLSTGLLQVFTYFTIQTNSIAIVQNKLE